MLQRLFRAILPTLLLLEAALSALWIWGLVPGFPARDMATIAIVSTRGVVSVFQMVSSWCLRTGRPFAATLTQRTLVAAGLLMTLEIGFRLAPTNLDPTFTWHVVIAYWAYVALAVLTLRTKLTR
jgi:hypothetical protein